jgi:amino acid transporter
MIHALLNQFAATCDKSSFLGLVPWYQYLDYKEITVSSGEAFCGVENFVVLKAGEQSDLPLIMLAVVDNLIRIAGLIAVAFVIYGGVQYATSQGNPDQTSKAQSTIINALIGLAIAIIAVAFVSFIGNRLT